MSYTKEEKAHALFEINEAIEESKELVAKCRSLADVLAEALTSVDERGDAFTGDTVLNTVHVIHKYSKEAENLLNNADRDLYALIQNASTLD